MHSKKHFVISYALVNVLRLEVKVKSWWELRPHRSEAIPRIIEGMGRRSFGCYVAKLEGDVWMIWIAINSYSDVILCSNPSFRANKRASRYSNY